MRTNHRCSDGRIFSIDYRCCFHGHVMRLPWIELAVVAKGKTNRRHSRLHKSDGDLYCYGTAVFSREDTVGETQSARTGRKPKEGRTTSIALLESRWKNTVHNNNNNSNGRKTKTSKWNERQRNCIACGSIWKWPGLTLTWKTYQATKCEGFWDIQLAFLTLGALYLSAFSFTSLQYQEKGRRGPLAPCILHSGTIYSAKDKGPN